MTSLVHTKVPLLLCNLIKPAYTDTCSSRLRFELQSCAERGVRPLIHMVQIPSSPFKICWILWHGPSSFRYQPQQQCGWSSCVWAPTLFAARLNGGTALWLSLPLKGLLFHEEHRPHTLHTIRLFTVSLHNERQGVQCSETTIPCANQTQVSGRVTVFDFRVIESNKNYNLLHML